MPKDSCVNVPASLLMSDVLSYLFKLMLIIDMLKTNLYHANKQQCLCQLHIKKNNHRNFIYRIYKNLKDLIVFDCLHLTSQVVHAYVVWNVWILFSSDEHTKNVHIKLNIAICCLLDTIFLPLRPVAKCMCHSLNKEYLFLFSLVCVLPLQGLPGGTGLKGESGDHGPQVSKKE